MPSGYAIVERYVRGEAARTVADANDWHAGGEHGECRKTVPEAKRSGQGK